MKRKNLFIDQHKLDEAKASLGVATDTEAVDLALARLTRKHRIVEALRQLVRVPDVDYAFEDDRPSPDDLK